MRVVASGGTGEVYRTLPISTVLIPRPYPDRLRHISFYVKINSGTNVIGVSLRDASNRSGLYRTWNITVDSTTFEKKIVDLTDSPAASAGTWDTSLVDEIAFTSITSGKTIDIDHIDLATTEFDFLQYQGYQEDTDTFNYFSATMTADFRNVGEPVDVLV